MFLFLRKDWLNNQPVIISPLLLLLFIMGLLIPQYAAAQYLEPIGRHIVVGVSGIDGYGLQVGTVSAKTLYVTELMVLSDLEPLVSGSESNSRVVLLPGIALRLLGFERLIGGAPYRGFDLDAGFRAGPGLSFSTDETQSDKDRRFEFVVEPFLRLSVARSNDWTWFLESGTTRPNIRVGLWIQY